MRRAGFTLIEIIVAVVLAGLTALIAAGLFAAASDGVVQLETAGFRGMKEANAKVWLSELVSAIELDKSQGMVLAGAADRVEFVTWTRTRYGWPERKQVSIEFLGETGTLVASLDGSGDVQVREGMTNVFIDYLGELGANSPWLAAWTDSSAVPLALRIRSHPNDERVSPDTLLLWIGERG